MASAALPPPSPMILPSVVDAGSAGSNGENVEYRQGKKEGIRARRHRKRTSELASSTPSTSTSAQPTTPQTLLNMAYALHLSIRPRRLSSRRPSNASSSMLGWEAGERALDAIGSRMRGRGRTVGEVLGLKDTNGKHVKKEKKEKARPSGVEVRRESENTEAASEIATPSDVGDAGAVVVIDEDDEVVALDDWGMGLGFGVGVATSSMRLPGDGLGMGLKMGEGEEICLPAAPRLGPVASPQLQPSPFMAAMSLGADYFTTSFSSASISTETPLTIPPSTFSPLLSPVPFLPITPQLIPLGSTGM
ncbi:hypothetical protein BT69DRAFT_1281582, partial [Atractiella rhizophila]